MNYSYWEYKQWLSNIDFTIVGSGIVGLSAAYFLKEKFPNSKVLILEKGMLPQGASTKNAGFACFGSASEVLSDLKSHTEEEVVTLVEQRFKGVNLLCSIVGKKQIDLQINGGHELFLDTQEELYQNSLEQLAYINSLLKPVFKQSPFLETPNHFGFQNIANNYISHKFEGQLDTGKLMHALLKKVVSKGVILLSNSKVNGFTQLQNKVEVTTTKFKFSTSKLFVTTNGFASQLINENVVPARAQVLITKPINNLKIKGTFHLDQGYYYFRNIDNRILLGGGRNLDFKTEETTNFGHTELIQKELERLLAEVILPDIAVEIEHRWSGIMGVGAQKKPIIKQLSNNVYCGVRMGGMGVAIGSTVGKNLAEMV
ncbi:FAD-dependent oxidoreductase [Croceivirga lutea]|uniref:NAD(P)/FAD-dependent oxidoreductase n=1 Tax=Croceivirga lutea TaxID=1775167 RepID=UPI001639BA75|nr:FAD-dependent oxidoreductase [Croceivirga lutea]GGG38449.1 FAD-dependent oxidoreductase [Croceivirga lutea]